LSVSTPAGPTRARNRHYGGSGPGASANVVVAGIAARSGSPISFWTFTRYGLVVVFATLAVSSVYVWLRYFALAG